MSFGFIFIDVGEEILGLYLCVGVEGFKEKMKNNFKEKREDVREGKEKRVFQSLKDLCNAHDH